MACTISFGDVTFNSLVRISSSFGTSISTICEVSAEFTPTIADELHNLLCCCSIRPHGDAGVNYLLEVITEKRRNDKIFALTDKTTVSLAQGRPESFAC